MDKVTLTRESGVSTITLNRPNSYNALDAETLEKLLELLTEVEHNDDRILILAGAGKAFCAGGDINMMTQVEKQEDFELFMDVVSEVSLKLYMLPKIVISAVNGSAAGLGLSFALTSDYIVANENAEFGMLFGGIGLIPDGGAHFHLQERLGAHYAKQFIWGLEKVKAKQANKMGLVDLVTEEKAEKGAEEVIQKVMMGPFKAIIRSKMLLHEAKQQELKSVLAAEKAGQVEMYQTEDHKEGITAFLDKRFPLFKGK